MTILHRVSRHDTEAEQMFQWSILSDLIKYRDRSSSPDMIPSLIVKPLDYRQH